MLKQLANKRQRLSSMMNDVTEQKDPIENLISRILYAEGDLDLNSQDFACLQLLKVNLPSIVEKLSNKVATTTGG